MSENRIGVVCASPDQLRERLLVSDIQLLDPTVAYLSGYGQREVIVPAVPRRPSAEETTLFVANNQTEEQLRLVSLPLSIGERAMELRRDPVIQFDLEERHDLGGGFLATNIGVRTDASGQPNVSVDDQGLLVGEHIDAFADPSYRIAVLNMGPGARYHRLTPGFSRRDLGNQPLKPLVRNAHLRSLLRPDGGCDLLAYWIRLDPPKIDQPDPMVDALIFSPVANYLHEGATVGSVAASTVVMFASPQHASDPVFSQYRSLV